MRDKKRIKRILKRIEKLWREAPDLRFGQLLINLNICEDELDLWNFEDNILEEHLERFRW